MKFGIAGIGIGRGWTEISEDEFTRARTAKQSLIGAMSVERKFDLLLENYAEFERELLGLALHQMIFGDLDWSSMKLDNLKVNRRLTNLLSAGRLYVDHAKHEAAALDCSEPELVRVFGEKCSAEYDSKLGYRVMEALRNYTQHRDLPVHRLTFATTVEPEGVFKNLVYRVAPSLVVAKLAEDGSLKKSVLAELSAIGPVVPLTPLVREYVEGISMVHESFRHVIEEDMPRWEGQFDWVWRRYEEKCPGNGRVVEVFSIDDEMNEVAEREQILSEIVDHRKNLARKNAVLTNLTKRFVSGSCELRSAP